MQSLNKIVFLFLLLGFSVHQTEQPVVLLFGGDCTFAEHFDLQVKNNFDYPFEKLDICRDADIMMVNLESCISSRGKKVEKKFNFRMKPKYVEVLKRGGIDIVTLANNHSYDYGEQGLFDTMKYLDSAGIKYCGAGRNDAAARRPVIMEVRNKKIAFLGYHNTFNAGKNRSGNARYTKQLIEADLAKLKSRGDIDCIVVNFHWGKEYTFKPLPFQRQLARWTIDAGADVIIGHHPHVTQPVEKYKGKYIAYSLGNFIFGGHSRRFHRSFLFQITLKDNELIPKIIPIQVISWQGHLDYVSEPMKIKEYISEK